MSKNKNNSKVNRNLKDSLFRYLFGLENHKDWTLQLFNALNNTDYENPDAIEFTTSENIVFMKPRNDTSFLLYGIVSMWEHQSTYCANMALRFYMYYAQQLKLLIEKSEFSLLGTAKIMLTPPQFVVFYNGEKEEPDEVPIHMNEHFPEDGQKIELNARMLNINLNHNQALMDKCPPLREYAWLIEEIRKNKREKKSDWESIGLAIERMPYHYEIKEILMKEKAMVMDIIMTEMEYRRELQKIARGMAMDMAQEMAQEEFNKGIEQGIEQGRTEGKETIITLMISDGWTDEEILSLCKGHVNTEEIKRIRKEHPLQKS